LFQDIAIDISDRPPNDHPQGIPYKLIGEACVPGISVISPSTIGSIFEEHMIVKQLNIFQYMNHDLSSGAGVYGEDENKFIFYNTIVGRKAKARFKISNSNKVTIIKIVVLGLVMCLFIQRVHCVFFIYICLFYYRLS